MPRNNRSSMTRNGKKHEKARKTGRFPAEFCKKTSKIHHQIPNPFWKIHCVKTNQNKAKKEGESGQLVCVFVTNNWRQMAQICGKTDGIVIRMNFWRKTKRNDEPIRKKGVVSWWNLKTDHFFHFYFYNTFRKLLQNIQQYNFILYFIFISFIFNLFLLKKNSIQFICIYNK